MARSQKKSASRRSLYHGVDLDQWQLGWSDVIAFGDDMNDLEMLGKSRIGVAMGNACEAVRLAADRTTGTNNEDGVAAVLEAMDF